MFEGMVTVRPGSDIRQDAEGYAATVGSIPASAPVPEVPRRTPGDVVALREIWDGRVWYAWPAVVVQDDPNLRMLHVPAHARCRQPVGDDGSALRIPADRWTLEEVERGSTSLLSFAFPDIPYAVILGFDETGALFEYYINLERPLTPSPAGFDTVDHLLDVTIAPDRSRWTWKDEDELREAVARGIFSEEDAEWFRFWGERGVEHVLLREPPFDEDWSRWRPDPSWPSAALPSGWETAWV
jgi:hypothetical protein